MLYYDKMFLAFIGWTNGFTLFLTFICPEPEVL